MAKTAIKLYAKSADIIPSVFGSLEKMPETKPIATTSITIAINIRINVKTHAKYFLLNKQNPSAHSPTPIKDKKEAVDVTIARTNWLIVLITGTRNSLALFASIDCNPVVLFTCNFSFTESEYPDIPLNSIIPPAINKSPPIIIAIAIIDVPFSI